MGFLRSKTNSTQTNRPVGYRPQTSLSGSPVPLLWGTNRVPGNVLWTGRLFATPVKQSGKGGKSGGKGGQQQYDYTSSIIIGLCEGPVSHIRSGWVDQTVLTDMTSSEPYFLSSTTVTPAHAATFHEPLGATVAQSYSVVANDYGSPGSVTYSGTQQAVLEQVSGTPGPGQYSVNPTTGVHTFNAAQVGSTVTIYYTWLQPNINGNSQQVTEALDLTLFPGAQGQAVWGYLSSTYPSQAIGYSGISYLAGQDIDLGTSAIYSNYNFELAGQRTGGAGRLDAEIHEVIQDFLTNPYYGCGFPSGNLGSLTELQNYCGANGLFISPFLQTQQAAADWLTEWLSVANAEAFFSEGLLKFRSYGDKTAVGNGFTFTPNNQPIYDLDDDDFISEASADGPIEMNRPSARDAYNWIQIEWLNRGNAYTPETCSDWNEDAIRKYGLRPEGVQTFHSICEHSVAMLTAATRLQRIGFVRNTYTFRLGWQYCLLEPMDLVTITDPYLGLTTYPVRILSLEEDDQGVITVTAEDFPWGTATPTLHPKQVTKSFGPGYYADPGNVNAPVFFEATAQMTQDVGYELLIALSGGANWGGCTVWESVDNTTYTEIGRQSTPTAMGVLTASLAAVSDPDTGSTLSVDLTESRGQLSGYTQAQADKFQSLILVDQEIMAYETATLTGSYSYNLTYLRRGLYGSPVQAHAVGASFVFLGPACFPWVYDAADVGVLHYFKFTSFNTAGQREQSLSEVTAYQFRITSPRAPYPLKDTTTAPVSGDVLFAASTFGLTQTYTTTTDNAAIAEADVIVSLPPKSIPSKVTTPPVISNAVVSSTGGTIAGGQTLLFALTALDSATGETTISNALLVTIPAGTNTNTVTVSITWGSGAISGNVYAGPDEARLRWQEQIGSTPSTWAITSYAPTGYGPPDAQFDHLAAWYTESFHGGVVGDNLAAVSGTLITLGAGVTLGVNQFAGYTLSVAASFNEANPVPIADTTIVSNTANTLTVSPDISAVISPNDVFYIRTKPQSVTANSFSDPNFVNFFAPSGLTVHQERGRIAWVIAGKGAGQRKAIADNTATTITLSENWDINPDSTSVIIIVSSTWSPLQHTQSYPLANYANWNTLTIPVRMPNLTGYSAVVQVFTVDALGITSDPAVSPFRELYLLGSAGGNTSVVPPGNVTLVGLPTLSALPASAQGVVNVQVTIPYTPPSPLGTFEALFVYLFAPDDITGDAIGGTGGTGPTGSPNSVMAGGLIVAADSSQYAVASSVSPASKGVLVDKLGYDPANLLISFSYPMPAAAQTWRLYAVSASPTVQNALVKADQPSPTPNVAFVVDPAVIGSGGSTGVSGAEYAPNALTLNLLPGSPFYGVDAGGQSGWQFGITWTNSVSDPLYSKLGGYDVILQGPDGKLKALNTVQRSGGVQNASQPEYISPVLPIPANPNSVYTIYLLPMDWNRNVNTLTPATAFCQVTVSFPSGSSGQENAPIVQGFAVSEVGYITNGSGQYVYRFIAYWTPPGDPRYGGVHLYRITPVLTAPGSDVSGQTQGAPNPSVPGQQMYVMDFTDFPTITGTWEFYALSTDTNNNANTFQLGVTPTATLPVGTPPQGATGQEFTAVPTSLVFT